MSPKIELPEEVLKALGDDPWREALEAVLLYLIRADRVSVAWAGEKLGLDRWESIRWYTSHGYPYPDITPEDLDEELRHAESVDPPPRRPRGRRATGREVTNYHDPETGEVRAGASDFVGEPGGGLDPEKRAGNDGTAE